MLIFYAVTPLKKNILNCIKFWHLAFTPLPLSEILKIMSQLQILHIIRSPICIVRRTVLQSGKRTEHNCIILQQMCTTISGMTPQGGDYPTQGEKWGGGSAPQYSGDIDIKIPYMFKDCSYTGYTLKTSAGGVK